MGVITDSSNKKVMYQKGSYRFSDHATVRTRILTRVYFPQSPTTPTQSLDVREVVELETTLEEGGSISY